MKAKYLYDLVSKNNIYAKHAHIIYYLHVFMNEDLGYFYNYYSNKSSAHKLSIDGFFKYLINDEEMPEEVRNYILMVMVTR